MRWIDIDLSKFTVIQQGFVAQRLGSAVAYHSPGLTGFERIEQIRDLEYAQVIVVDPVRRHVAFGRDYLGHYPLTYACDGKHLYISDSYNWVYKALLAGGIRPGLSEEALALYFTMGFVPHGQSLYREIVNCEATGYYECIEGHVRRVDLFSPIAISDSDDIAGIGEAIGAEVRRVVQESDSIDIWCSGGLDSSIMAVLFNDEGRRADLLTLAYGHDIHANFGDGERRFVRAVAQFTGAPMRDVDLAPHQFETIHEIFASHHNGPVMDFPLPPKYALAKNTRDLAVTGEAGDTFFGGTKNAGITYAQHKQPEVSLGEHYAIAHHRFFSRIPEIFRRGSALKRFAIEHCNKLVERYPGDMQRKLFYLNSHEKLASMIFAQSYFPGQLFGKRIRHPIASLSVYRAAFSVPDHRKFSYPRSKIALHELYGRRLPEAVVRRKKSGTQLPLQHYLQLFERTKFDFSRLANTNLFCEEFLEKLSLPNALETVPPLFLYAFVTLNLWLTLKENPHVESLPAETDRIEQSAVAGAV